MFCVAFWQFERACDLFMKSLTNYLVGGWTNPFEKYDRQNGFIFPNFRGEHWKKNELPPPSYRSILTETWSIFLVKEFTWTRRVTGNPGSDEEILSGFHGHENGWNQWGRWSESDECQTGSLIQVVSGSKILHVAKKRRSVLRVHTKQCYSLFCLWTNQTLLL